MAILNLKEAVSSYNIQNATRNQVKIFESNQRFATPFLTMAMQHVYEFPYQTVSVGIDSPTIIQDPSEVPVVREGQDTVSEYVGQTKRSEAVIQKFETATDVTTEGLSGEQAKAELAQQILFKQIYLKSQINAMYLSDLAAVKPDAQNPNNPFRTAGFFNQVQTNKVLGEKAKLDYAMIMELIKKVHFNSKFGITENHYLFANAEVLQAITEIFKTIEKENTGERFIAGANVQAILSAYGSPLKLVEDKNFKSDKIAIVESSNVATATLATPNKGLFYERKLASMGDYDRHGIYSFAGLLVLDEVECGSLTDFSL